MNEKKILYVEDDLSLIEGLKYTLEKNSFLVDNARTVMEAYQFFRTGQYDLLLLDVMLPDEDGLAIVQKLRSRRELALLPIILVTARTAEIDKVKGLDIGADDYLTKPFGVMELISRVKAMLRRSQAGQGERCLKVGDIVMDQGKHAVTVHGIACELTYKEYELLKLLLINAGMVMTRDVILDRVWGSSFEGESRTLDMHIKTLRRKLGNQGCLIRTVRNVGYIMGGE